MRLKNKVAIITGASKGLGERMALAFSREGATVILSSRNHDRLEDVRSRLSDPSRSAVIPTNVRSQEEVERLIDDTLTQFDQIDLMINNAGVKQATVLDGEQFAVHQVPIDAWDTIIGVNLRGVFLCTRAVLPTMLEQDSGRMIHITSGMGRYGKPKRAPYVASKHGLEGLHKSLSAELEETGVESLLLNPGGATNTGFQEHLSGSERARSLPPDIIEEPAIRLAAGEGTHGAAYDASEFELD